MDDLREVLANCLTLRDDARTDDPESDWPVMSFELDDMTWQGAEPDVGIMSDYLDDYSVEYTLGERTFGDTLGSLAFIDALYEAIGPDIIETQDELAAIVERLVEKEAREVEPPEPDYPEYDD